jgi:hypothetical protein
METRLTEQESMEIITKMIHRARNNVRKGNANSMILNGYAAAIIAIANFVLLQLLPDECRNYSFYIWCLMIPLPIANYYIRRKVDKTSIVKTEIDGILSSAWNGFTVSIVILLIILYAIAILFNAWQALSAITPTIMAIVAIPEFVTARACRFKPFLWGAIIFWTGALLCVITVFLWRQGDWQFIIFAASMISGFIIPGHKLNKSADKTHV